MPATPRATFTVHGYLVRPFGARYGHTIEHDGEVVATFEYHDVMDDGVTLSYNGVETDHRNLTTAIDTLPAVGSQRTNL